MNHRRRFVACVDAKCGSSTIVDWFSQTVPPPPAALGIDSYRIPAESVQDRDDFTRVFFVRDPMNRLVSFYCQFVVETPPTNWCFADDAGEIPLDGRTFSEFLHVLADLADRQVQFQHHLQPQTRVLGAVEFDYVVRLEDLDARVEQLNADLGVTALLRRINASNYGSVERPGASSLAPADLRGGGRATPASFWDPELSSLAREMYRSDVEYYERNLWQPAHGDTP